MKYFSLILSFVSLLFIAPLAQACPQGGGGNCNQTDAGSTQNTNQPSEESGNPINVVTGNKFQYETDYQAAGDLSALAFNRFYNSLNTDYDDGLGQGWSHSFELRMTLKPQKGIAQVIQSDGRRIIFKRQGTDGALYHGLSPQDGVINTLADGKVVWSLQDGRRIIFLHQKPIEIAFLGNKTLTLKYYQGHIRLVTDNHGRRLVFNYTQGNTALGSFAKAGDDNIKLAGHLESIELPDGEKIRYRYDNDLNLSQVIYPDNTSRIYHYENLEFPNHLTGITDRAGKRFATWAYDDEGRANLSEHAGGAEKVTLAYHIPEQAGDIGNTVVTNSLGEKSTYTWRFYENISQALLLSSEGPGCSTCPPANRTYTYNNQYQIETITDTKTGAVTRYSYDKLGRTQKTSITPKGEDERLVARYEYQGNQTRPTLIARPSVNKDGEHLTEIEYNDDQLPMAITEKGYSPSELNKTRKVKLSYDQGNITEIRITADGKDKVMRFSYDVNGLLKQRKMPSGEELIIETRDKASRPIAVKLKRVQQNKFLNYKFKYDWEGNATEISQGGRVLKLEYDLSKKDTKKRIAKTTITLPQKDKNITISENIVNTLISGAYAANSSKASISGVKNQSDGIATLFELKAITNKVQTADSATTQTYLSKQYQKLPITFTPSPGHICPVTPGVTCQQLKEWHDYGRFALCSYSPISCDSIDKGLWTRKTPAQLGISSDLLEDGSYSATVLVNNITGEVVLSFRGTDDFTGDIYNDVVQGIGITTNQYKKAIELARELDFIYPNKPITVTGHSLGGGLATAAALELGTDAIVFNAAGLHPNVAANNGLGTAYNNANDNITNVTVDGEALTTLQESGSIKVPGSGGLVYTDPPEAPGKHFVLTSPSDVWIKANSQYTPFEWINYTDLVKSGTKHRMISVMESLRQQHATQGCKSLLIN